MSPVAPPAQGDRLLPRVPGPPTAPTAPSRPNSWPGGNPAETPPGAQQSFAPPANAPNNAPLVAGPSTGVEAFSRARIIARVGAEAILESDLVMRGGPPNYEVIGSVDKVLADNKDQIPPEQYDRQREELIKKVLQGVIQTRMVYLDAKRTIPPESWTHIEEQLTKEFEEGDKSEGGKGDAELEKMMKRFHVETRQELNLKLQKLQEIGTSLEREKKAFIERDLVQKWVRMQIKRNDEVTDQMISYYHNHLNEFTTPPRARWEELMTSFSKYPSRDAARDTLAAMRNQVFAGAPFALVAKGGSDGITASSGGQKDWTNKGSLVCKELDQALFGLPVGTLSPIIEGPTGFHIVRVTCREPEKVTPFRDAQVEIKKKIIDKSVEKQYREYLSKVGAKTPVWTIFDLDASNKSDREQMANRQREPLR
jgi:peptidyl-prolyl cis-trans isomerase SurA